MEKKMYNIFNDGRLFVWDKDDLERAEASVPRSQVASIRVGAKCYSANGLTGILQRLSRYANVREIEVADDRIPDADMEDVKAAFLTEFPGIEFKWSYDCLVGGKYGR